MKTELCERLGIEHPIMSVGFGAGAGPELVAAVSNAGAFGVLGGGGGYPLLYLREQIQRVRALTAKPFGVNVILEQIEEGPIETCIDERVPLLVFFWGDPRPYVEPAHRNGVKVAIQVGSVQEAAAAADAGVDFVIAQGVEAGGHVRGTTALSVLVPAVVDAIAPVPVVASGGVADGRGLVAALALGAQGVSMGTRFVASVEAFVPQLYKEGIVTGQAEDTIYSEDLFDVGWENAPHRVLRNAVVRQWEAAGKPRSGQRPGEGTTVGAVTRAGETWEVPRYSASMPTPQFSGDIESLSWWAGQSCALVHDIKPAGQIVHDVVREAQEVIDRLARIGAAPQAIPAR